MPPGFYSWFRNGGRLAHVWLLLASPTIKQIDSFKHTQTTYVFRKDHKHDVAAVLGQIARVCPPFSESLSPHLLACDLQTQADLEVPALDYRPSTSKNRASSASCTSSPRPAKEVKKEEEEKLVQLVEHACESLVPVDLISRDKRWH